MLNYSYTLSVFSVKKKKKEIEQKNATNTVRLRELEQCSQKKKRRTLHKNVLLRCITIEKSYTITIIIT